MLCVHHQLQRWKPEAGAEGDLPEEHRLPRLQHRGHGPDHHPDAQGWGHHSVLVKLSQFQGTRNRQESLCRETHFLGAAFHQIKACLIGDLPSILNLH